MLQFQSSSDKQFYWLQEATTDRDQIVIQQVNTLIQSQEDNEDQYLDEDTAMEDVEEPGRLDRMHDVDDTWCEAQCYSPNPVLSPLLANTAASTGEPTATIAPSAAFAPAAPITGPSTTNTNPLGASPAAGGSSLTLQQMDQLRHLLGGIQVPRKQQRKEEGRALPNGIFGSNARPYCYLVLVF